MLKGNISVMNDKECVDLTKFIHAFIQILQL